MEGIIKKVGLALEVIDVYNRHSVAEF